MYKLIAIDIDGTLVDSKGKISEENKLAIKNAREKGTEVVLTSGRTPQSIKPIAKEIGSNNYLIAGNGAMVFDIKENKVIYGKYLSKKKVLELIKICHENDIFYNIYLKDKIVTETIDYNIMYYDSENKNVAPERRVNIEIKNDVLKFVKEYEGDDFLKVVICEQNKIAFERIVEILKNMKQISFLDMKQRTVKTIKSENGNKEIAYYYTEIMDDEVDKWSALKFLIKKLKIKKQEVLAIGDNINDEEMLKNAEMGVAMGNSYPRIKEIANYIAPDNNSNGVADAINKHNT